MSHRTPLLPYRTFKTAISLAALLLIAVFVLGTAYAGINASVHAQIKHINARSSAILYINSA